jgi:hypothetical protein
VVQQISPAAPADATPPSRPGLRDRIRSWFGGRSSEAKEPTASGADALGQTPYGMPPRQSDWLSSRPATDRTTVLRPNFAGARPVAAEPSDLDKAGHERDYSWITGRLARDGGHWIISYAGTNEIDRFGGRLPLTGNLDASRLREGALVCVVGQVTAGGRNPLNVSGPVYQVRQINVIEPGRP